MAVESRTAPKADFKRRKFSWLNAVEGFFAKLSKQRVKRGAFHLLISRLEAINRFVAKTNDDPKPFHWTKNSDKIIAAVNADASCWIG